MGSGHDFDHSDAVQSPSWDRPLARRDLFRYGAALGFGAVGAGMLASCTPVDGGYPQPVQAPDIPPARAKYLVIVIVDGCRADYVDPSLHLPNLQGMIQSGTMYTNAWSGSMESITPACHASIGTGRFAKNNGGILGFYWENPSSHVYGEAVNLTNSRTAGQLGNNIAVDPTSLEQILQAQKVPTMASYLKDVDPRAKVYAGAGAKFYAADAAGGPDADFITYMWNNGPNYYRGVNIGGPNHKPLPESLLKSVSRDDYTWSNYGELDKHGHPLLNAQGDPIAPATIGEVDSMTIDLARKVVERERPRIVILNLGDEDWPYGHLNGGILSPKYWKPVIKNVDAGLGRLMDTYKQLGIFHETVFMFLGDHGMVPIVQQVDHTVVHDAVYSSGASFVPNGSSGGVGADFHTGGFMWLTDPQGAPKAAEFIDDAIEAGNLPGVLAVYFRAEAGGRQQYLPTPNTSRTLLPASDHAYRYLLETLNGANAPHMALLFQEWTGVTGAGGPGQQWFGDHGGASWSSHWVPLIMSGPGIHRGHVSNYPARLVDIAPTGLRLMGVPYAEMDGVVLSDALQNAYSSERAQQRLMRAELAPIVSAMKHQANLDIQYIRTYKPANPPPGSPGSPRAGGLTGIY